jgi:hypothetical protein
MASLSPPEELLAAFSAFDDHDNGQVDVEELRDALLSTAPEEGLGGGKVLTEAEVERVMAGFTGRKTFGKMGRGGGRNAAVRAFGNARGDVFRYQEFVGAVTGGNKGGEEEK